MTKSNWDELLIFTGENLFKVLIFINSSSETINVRNGIIVEVERDSKIPLTIKRRIKK